MSAPGHELVAPRTLPEVLSLLMEGWRPIAGGTDLMVLLQAGQLRFRRLVSLQHLDGLRSIDVTDTHVSLGARVTYTAIRNHPVLQSEFELLCRAAAWTGGIANQNRGTLGGNIVNASPAADTPPMLLVYDAELELTSTRGTRRVGYDAFHTGYKAMQMRPDELLTRIVLPRKAVPSVTYARKVGARKAMAISKVNMGALAWHAGGRIADIRIAVGSVAPVPLRCRQTEAVLTGSVLSEEVRALAAETLAAEIAPIDDIRSTAVYRRRVSVNLLAEFLRSIPSENRLHSWNAATPQAAQKRVLACCGSSRWAKELVAQRPFENEQALIEAAGRIWWHLDSDDWLEAFRAHPRIGASPAKPWESQEQSGMQAADMEVRQAIADANIAYEAKFGFIYIVCATGKTAEQMLANIQERLPNDQATELREAAAQQLRITELRLRKWLNE